MLFSYAPSAEGIELRVDGRTKASLPGGLAVDPGPRTIELRARATGETLYEGELDFAAGERADLAALLPGPWQVRVAARERALVDRIARAHGGRAIAENREGGREGSDGAPASG